MSDVTEAPEPSAAGSVTGVLSRYRALLVLAIGQLLVGVLLGLIWLSWAPTSLSYSLSDGAGRVYVVPDEAESQIAGDGRFVVLTVIAGVLFGLAAWRLRKLRGPVTLAVLAVSSVLASLLARYTGQLLAGGSKSAPANTAFHPKLVLHGTATLWLQALFAVLLYTAMVGISADHTLGRGIPAEPLATEPLPV